MPTESNMLKYKKLTTPHLFQTVIIVGVILSLTCAIPVWGHGGKTHGGTGFSSFQAVKKATELYDRLITMEKLEEAWEIELTVVKVITRQASGKMEYVVQFSRINGHPESVYFFFDQQGQYIGSNFTGQ